MHKDTKRREALLYHARPKPGKIEVIPTKKYSTQRDLSLAYSPGVAEPCTEIHKKVENVYKYTNKGNLVAVISNGTAVLGLGDIGPEASKPVMEGKALLFKIFADIDVFDIEVDAKNVDDFINTVKNIAPTFGGINLEDIKAPESFEIEERLINELDIPLMHDDQHGTAIITGAALLNALEIADKDISKVKIMVSGAGSAALSCIKLFIALGLNIDNIFMFDKDGMLHQNRTDLIDFQMEIAKNKTEISMKEAIQGADVFLGLSVGNLLTPEMLLTMADNPIVFAMANPIPEIDYNLAMKTRDDIIMATGRSDHPNQVNNVLGFPYIFRGALDVRAKKINHEMKMAAVYAIAKLAKTPVPEQVNIAYGETKLVFGKDYIIPKPFDPRLISTISPAVAKAAMDSGVAQYPIQDLERYATELDDRMGNYNKIIRLLVNRAKTDPKRVVFAEADQLDVLKVAQIVYEEKIGIPILLGRKDVIEELKNEIDFSEDVEIIDPKDGSNEEQNKSFAKHYWKEHKRDGITLIDANKLMRERNYYASMMVNQGLADAMVTGYSRSYPNAIKPILHLIDKAPGVDKIATTNLLLTKRGPMFLSDTAINPNPTSEELARIALMTAKTVRMFGLEPIVAMVSFSNFGSSPLESPQKVKKAVEILHRDYPDLIVDGDIQVDFALNPDMLKETFPFSKLVGKKVNTLIYPNLESANISYKSIKELYEVDSVGPIILGLEKPVHIFQMGASVEEMVNMAAVAVVDAQEKQKRKRN